jgi:outer membrane protein TolC
MIRRKKRMTLASSGWLCGAVVFIARLVLSGAVAGQTLPTSVSAPVSQLPIAPGARLIAQFTLAYEDKNANLRQAGGTPTFVLSGETSEPLIAPGAVRRITLDEAEQQAASPNNNPMVRLGQLQVEVADQNRLGTLSTFFPQIGSDFANFHFNKFMGQELQVVRPITGETTTVGLPLLGKDQTFVAVTATQPVTPLFQLRQLYKISVADENIARAKAGMPVSETANNVVKNYYGLLIAQRQLAYAQITAKGAEDKWLVASNPATPMGAGSDDVDVIEASKALVIASAKVEELTASLNEMIGLPPDTKLELVPPDPHFENISMGEASDRALAANPDVIEAEQNVVKARAASTLQKLAYVPTVAVTGGYAYNNNAVPLLPRDFSFIGVVATYNIFDFGKREHTIKGANATAEMAEIALQLTKAKVGAAVKSSYLELERSRQLSELTRRLVSAIQLQKTSSEENAPNIEAAKEAKVEAEMFQADLDYSQALANLKALIGEQ